MQSMPSALSATITCASASAEPKPVLVCTLDSHVSALSVAALTAALLWYLASACRTIAVASTLLFELSLRSLHAPVSRWMDSRWSTIASRISVLLDA